MSDFRYPPSQREERDEYRNRFKFTDEDIPIKKNPSKPKTKTDYFVRLILGRFSCFKDKSVVIHENARGL